MKRWPAFVPRGRAGGAPGSVLPHFGAALVIVLAGLAAYANSFSGPFVFLDVPAIVANPTIRHLGALRSVLLPPSAGGVAVGGRPIVNLSFALNYALGGLNPWGYHAVNLLIHILAGLVLFGVVGRTLDAGGGLFLTGRSGRPGRSEEGGRGRGVALAVALIWVVHPLQTESVTYIVQRAESLMGLFYLLTLYCFIRAVEPRQPQGIDSNSHSNSHFGFSCLAVGFCLLGMGTKEVMVSAPVIVFLYDRTFVSGTFREAWRRHWGVLLALAATWIPLVALVAGTGGNRGGTSGFGTGFSWSAYALTQFPAILRYLRLAVWPHPLDFHYGAQWVSDPVRVLPQALAVVLLLAASVFAFTRKGSGRQLYNFDPSSAESPQIIQLAARPLWTWAGFCGLFFFAILAPTSLVPGVTQTAAEHRMYLALAPLAALAVFGVQRGRAASCIISTLLARKAPKLYNWRPDPFAQAVVLGAVTLALIAGTVRRNRVYRSEEALWADTAAKSPWNPYAFNNLGIALVNAGRGPAALEPFRRAIALKPDYAEAHNNLGLVLAAAGRGPEAVDQYRAALRFRPHFPEAEANLGVALANSGRMPEAIGHFRKAVALDPGYANAHNDLAVALAASGRPRDAIGEYELVLRLEEGRPEVHYNLGNALMDAGRTPEAIAQYEAALRLRAAYPEAEANLGAALAGSGRLAEALGHYDAALRLAPGDPDVVRNRNAALRALGRSP